LKRNQKLITFGKKLRVEQTEVEAKLWTSLRNRQLNNFKFVRQAPVGAYIADFLCRERWLIVELDGSQHADSIKDELRTKSLNELGYSVLRFWNTEVTTHYAAVLETILAALEGRLEPAAAGNPSPDLRFAPATLSPMGRGKTALIHGRSRL
jgi:very-short-patch-repair endonuclease